MPAEPIATPSPTNTPSPTPSPTLPPSPTPKGYRPGWNLVWHDEFDGDKLDLKNWTFDIGGHGWGNEELEMYTKRPENVRVADGMLVIEARKERINENKYSSARIKTQNLQTWKYGRIEARIKVPQGQGMWPAFWMLGDDVDQIGWPRSGEIDIMEFVGAEADQIHATIHGPGYADAGIGSSITVSPDSLKNDFHTYSIEWQENEIRWYFDDSEYFKLSTPDVPGRWVFDHPFFILLNLAVGGRWPGSPDATTVFPQSMLVDYVRVFQKP